MEIKINNPRKSWEKILNNKIDEINESAEEQIKTCKKSLDNFFLLFNIKPSSPELKPVEYISLITDNLSTSQIMEEIVGQKTLYYAKGTNFGYNEIPSLKQFETYLRNVDLQKITETTEETFNVVNIDFRIIISKNVLDELLEEYEPIFSKTHESIEMDEPKHFEIKIYENDFTNFAIRDENELIQFSTTPLNEIIGLYKSRQEEVVNIFNDKFFDLFNKGTDIGEYFKKNLEIGRAHV